ncbi:putatively inactive leucine-rich repeat receptor-like protein kinase [Citrus sinensis]|uniref:probably inactive leucine-rich repeat receptor-like protein kinase At5g06940 n=1 Tax=Citrus sinensis TaxID=2711 RepID=UPI00219FB627|nr:probably inactive leucine-rich repeat receptor-like protein kinase At5g06940 [Citrus sinensis]KAH9648093.1 putatively inactive leucine-rich repeat receptor-like protein kinase [Citrus sinensis]
MATASSPLSFLCLHLLVCLTFFAFTSASTEKDTLLSFKASIDDSKNSLSTWSNTSNIHYCNWTGVTCVTTATASLTVASINLQSLNLSGEISSSVCELSRLSNLNLADNLFNQPIPLHLSQCSSLETLNLSNNLIWGTIPDQISQFGSLKVLDLSRNHIEGKIPESIGSLVNLQVLNLGSNLLSGSVPFVFGNFSELVVLDLSQNAYLISEIPSDIGKLEKLEQLFLQSSGFHGVIPDSFVGLQSLSILDLSQNNLTGEVPQSLGSSLLKLVSFDVSQNKLSGSFPNGICTANGLVNLSLHKNFFNGSIPGSINECLNLERFQVQDNGFSGDFPDKLWSLPRIKLIRAESNRFSGAIPDSISMAAQLEQVQIDNNRFTSSIPQGLGSVKSLYRFSASQNSFYGSLPPNFCDSPVMSIINLSQNSISGQIPELKKCRKLVSLSLADNSLTGEIPPSLAELPVLTYLDLSDNNLTGPIPQGLQNLKLALFNVSFNKLSGRVPYSLISGLPASYLQGNPGLCGPGLSNSCDENQPKHRTSGPTALACVMISLAVAVGIMMVAAGFFVFHRYSKKKSQAGVWRSLFFYPLRVTEHDLVIGMDEKSSAGNGGPFGRVYILSLPSGELIAVKKLVNFGCQSSKTLKTEVKTLAKIRHKNIVKVLGFFHSDESIFLIYEFLQMGSLGDLICRQDFQLQWSIRLKIAIGVAQGLAYLHKDYVPHLLHRNVKSKNILLDADFEPKLTDFALDRIVGEAAFQSTMSSEYALSCYNAPEYGYSKKATEQMDAYSFGVVLLELITGRQAEQAEPAESLDVVKWVRRKINITNGAIQVLDPKIANCYQQQMLGALEIALRCTSVMPEKRPSMFEVVKALHSLSTRTSLLSIELSSSQEHSIPL